MGLGADIRKRRESFGFSPVDVASLASMAAVRILAIESGAENPTTSELGSLADALACNAADLARGIVDDPRRSVARFRGAEAAKMPSARDLRLLARAAEAGRILASLRKRLGTNPTVPLRNLRAPSAPSSAKEAWQDGYDLGVKARNQLSPAQKPIDSVQELIERFGAHVADVDFEDSAIEAASLYELDAAPVILLNRRAPKFGYALARRAVLAHELCHLLNDGGEKNLTVVSFETDGSAVEQRANGFAPSFIAPAGWVTLRSKDPIAMAQQLATDWGLSFEGAAWHLKNLKRISAETAEELGDLKRKPKLESTFEQPLPRTPPDQFEIEGEPSDLTLGLLSETAIIAAAEGVISRGRAAEILTLR